MSDQPEGGLDSEREEEHRIIDFLRAESASLKQCFTQYSFQTLTFSMVVLGASLTAMNAQANAAFAPMAMVPVLMAVGRLGLYKYASANRVAAYELHLSRTRTVAFPESKDGAKPFWTPSMRLVPWEEAMRAWRIVQPTIFRRIYRCPEDEPWIRRFGTWPLLRKLSAFDPRLYSMKASILSECTVYLKSRNSQAQRYPWFMPLLLMRSADSQADGITPAYYTGSFLSSMLSILYFAQFVMLVPAAVQAFNPEHGEKTRMALAGALVIVLISILLRNIRVKDRRQNLENELLSIHSCAVVWHAVVLAHHRACIEAPGLTHYTERLALAAQEVARDPMAVKQWIARQSGGVAKE